MLGVYYRLDFTKKGEDMERIRRPKEEVVRRVSETFTTVVRASMNEEKASTNAQWAREKYWGLSSDALADVLIKRAAQKTKWEGAVTGLGVTGTEALAATPLPEPTHKVVAVTGGAALLITDIAYTTRIQVQLLLEIAQVYDCPFERDDEEDIWLVFKAALGLKGTEQIGTYGRFVFAEAARKQFRKLLRTGIRRAVQERVVKIAGPRVAKYLGEKYVLRLVPFFNAGIGYAFNNRVTKSVGKWAKVKAKVRAFAFKQVKRIGTEEPEALVWVLPIIFYVGTADDKLTENVLALYSQTNKRMPLNEEQLQWVEELIDEEELFRIFATELPKISSEKARKALYDIALTTAAVNLEPQEEHEACLSELAGCLNVKYSKSDLKDKVRCLKH